MANRLSLQDRVLNHLWENGEITSWEAIKEYGITRLSAIIFKLRKQGYIIENEWVNTKNRYGDDVRFVNYKLIKNNFQTFKPTITIKEPFIKFEEVKYEQHNN